MTEQPTWIVRRATTAYLVLFAGVVLSFAFAEYRYQQGQHEDRRRAIVNCEAGNERSLIQKDDYQMSIQQAQTRTIERILGLSTEQANELRRFTVENAERRISSLPYLDCKTGKRIPIPR